MSAPALRSVTEYVDDSVGVTRRVLVDDQERPICLNVEFHSMRGKFAKHGQVFRARVLASEPGGNGQFVDIGIDPPGFLRTGSPLAEGTYCDVKIAIEARQDKGPAVSRVSLPRDEARPDGVGLIKQAAQDPFLVGVNVTNRIEGGDASSFVTEVLDSVDAEIWPIPGGGRISIEQTRALVAVDVDAAGRRNKGSREHLALTANLEAVSEIARALSLKGLAGLVVIDLLKMKDRANQKQVEDRFAKGLQLYFGKACKIGRVSPLGLLEASIPRSVQSYQEMVANLPNVEKRALDLFAELTRLGQEDRGRLLTIEIGLELNEWLRDPSFNWSGELESRIGKRSTFVVNPQIRLGDETIRSN